MDEKMNELICAYQNEPGGRRVFLKKLAKITGSTVVAMSILPVLEDQSLTAAEKKNKVQEILDEFVTYPIKSGQMKAYMARPVKGKKFPAVIVIHENRGLVPHIQDVTRRMAKEGFLTLAPDALSQLGGTPEDITNVGELFAKLDNKQTIANFVAAVNYLKTHPLSNGKVGCTGFCWGGAMTNQVAVNSPDLDAAVPYYGKQPETEEVPRIKAPILAHYAENDDRINAGIEKFEEALKENHKEYQIFKYPGTGHAFNNDSNPARYNAEAATLAWGRTVEFFKKKLK
jgi:carboxymethylenebutenolidase